MLQVGQKVVVVKSDKIKVGRTGQVAVIDEDKEKHNIGVFLTTKVKNGHECDGYVPEGYGRWFAKDQLVAVID